MKRIESIEINPTNFIFKTSNKTYCINGELLDSIGDFCDLWRATVDETVNHADNWIAFFTDKGLVSLKFDRQPKIEEL